MDDKIGIKTDDNAAKKKNGTPNVSTHMKRVVLDYLKQHGCTHASLEATAHARRHNSQQIIDFICQSYANAVEHVNRECDCVSLSNINQWLQLLQSAELATRCEYEAAAVVNAIVRNEPQPEPAELGGINMGQVYVFLEHALTGQPQQKLSAASEAFLFREIELLIADANSEHSDDLARRMGQNLYDRQEYDYAAAPHKLSLDPLLLDE
ncbi:hypothetical protein KR222_007387 [Zaprionus bogoriensis]|nr:hypothetical protein KR222_007387 [Zaprionus bogoriensis]